MRALIHVVALHRSKAEFSLIGMRRHMDSRVFSLAFAWDDNRWDKFPWKQTLRGPSEKTEQHASAAVSSGNNGRLHIAVTVLHVLEKARKLI